MAVKAPDPDQLDYVGLFVWTRNAIYNHKHRSTKMADNPQFRDLQQQSEFMRGHRHEIPAARVNAKGAFSHSSTTDVPVFKAGGVKVRSLDFFSPPPMPIISSVATLGFPEPEKIISRSSQMTDRC